MRGRSAISLVGNPEIRRTCTLCNVTLPGSEFYVKDKRLGTLRSRCRTCYYLGSTAWRKRNPGVLAASKKRTRQKRWQSDRDRQLFRAFGLHPGEYEVMLTIQGGVCAICRRPETRKHQSGRVKNLAVDHCHETGRVRGLLCIDCNHAIGKLQDDPALLRCAADYVVKHMSAAMMVA